MNPEEEKTTTSQETSQKNTKNKNIILIAVGVIVVLAIVGTLFGGKFSVSNKMGEKMGEKFAEKILEEQFGGDVDVDTSDGSVSVKTDKGTFSAGDKAKWPSDIPSSVPKFSGGTIVMAGSAFGMEAGTGWQIVVSNVSENDVVDYQKSLKATGWTTGATMDIGSTFFQMTKGELMIVVMHNTDDKTVSITVGPKK